LDQRIKDYADSIYHRTHTQSADTLNADRIAYLRQRAAQGSADFPWSGIDTQRVLRVYSDHIDRLIRARFESFRDAFEEAGLFPSEEDMSLVLNELKSVRETNVENANLAITSFVKTRGGIWQGAGPTDVLQALSAATARGHDRVLSDWKVWRDSVRLRRGGSAALQMEKSNDSSTVPLDPAVEAATGNDSSLRVFLCHSSADKAAVRDLYKFLKASGFDPWLDEEDLVAGQDWEYEIRKAVRESDVVLVCLSQNSINKSGFIQKELKYALDVADEQPEGVIFIIPLKSGDRKL